MGWDRRGGVSEWKWKRHGSDWEAGEGQWRWERVEERVTRGVRKREGEKGWGKGGGSKGKWAEERVEEGEGDKDMRKGGQERERGGGSGRREWGKRLARRGGVVQGVPSPDQELTVTSMARKRRGE